MRRVLVFFICLLFWSAQAWAVNDVRVVGAKRVVSGRKTVTSAGTAVAFSASSQPCNAVLVSGLEANTDVVCVGDSAVLADPDNSRKGVCLFAGQTEYLPGGNLSATYIDSAVSGEGVSYACYTS